MYVKKRLLEPTLLKKSAPALRLDTKRVRQDQMR